MPDDWELACRLEHEGAPMAHAISVSGPVTGTDKTLRFDAPH